jgi:uncharacterized protein (TIGR02246 family)
MSPSIPTSATPAWDVVQRWVRAFEAGDTEAITALYAPTAVMLGTGSKTLLTTPAQVREYFMSHLLPGRRFVERFEAAEVTVITDDVVVVTPIDVLAAQMQDQSMDMPGRVTFVIGRTDAGWRIVAFHRSALPA